MKKKFSLALFVIICGAAFVSSAQDSSEVQQILTCKDCKGK